MFVLWSDCSNTPFDLFCDPPSPRRLTLTMFWLCRVCTLLLPVHSVLRHSETLPADGLKLSITTWWLYGAVTCQSFENLQEPKRTLNELHRQIWKQTAGVQFREESETKMLWVSVFLFVCVLWQLEEKVGSCCFVSILDTKAEVHKEKHQIRPVSAYSTHSETQHNVCKQCYHYLEHNSVNTSALLQAAEFYTAIQCYPKQQCLHFSDRFAKGELVVLLVVSLCFTAGYGWVGSR